MLKNTGEKLSSCDDHLSKKCDSLIKKYVNLLYQKDKVEEDLTKNYELCKNIKND